MADPSPAASALAPKVGEVFGNDTTNPWRAFRKVLLEREGDDFGRGDGSTASNPHAAPEVPPAPKDKDGKATHAVLAAFVAEAQAGDEYHFEASLNGKSRRRAHEIADLFGLEHVSVGEGKARHLVARVPAAEATPVESLFLNGGYIGLSGVVVGRVGRIGAAAAVVPPEFAAAQQARDGDNFHITVMANKEIAAVLRGHPEEAGDGGDADDAAGAHDGADGADGSDPESEEPVPGAAYANVLELFDGAAAAIRDDWSPLGVGCAWDDDSSDGGDDEADHGDRAVDDADVFFVAVAWPSAAAFRAACGLEPRDFHITVGFRVKDLHQVPKGSETVVVDFADLSR